MTKTHALLKNYVPGCPRRTLCGLMEWDEGDFHMVSDYSKVTCGNCRRNIVKWELESDRHDRKKA